jgi:hypothetical protein
MPQTRVTPTLYKTTGIWRGLFRLVQVGLYNFFGPTHSLLSVVKRVGLNREFVGELETMLPRKRLVGTLPRMSAAFLSWAEAPAIQAKEVHV